MRTLPLLLALHGCADPAGPEPPPLRNPERFLYLAVLEGLHEDGVDPAHAKRLADPQEPGHFVDKCPICEPVRFAFATYAVSPAPRMYSFKEDAAPAALTDALASPERDRRMSALRDLVDRYVARKLARSALTQKDLAGFRAWLAEARKKGMSYKRPSFGDACPSCDGAALNR